MCPRPISSYANKEEIFGPVLCVVRAPALILASLTPGIVYTKISPWRIRKKGLLALIDYVFAGVHRSMAVKSSCCHCCWEDYLLVVYAFKRPPETDFLKGCIDPLVILLVAFLVSKVTVTK
jgi:hypothetical protein